MVVVTADHSHSMSFIGYDGRNTSVFDNVALTHHHDYGPSFVSPFGTFTKVMNAIFFLKIIYNRFNMQRENSRPKKIDTTFLTRRQITRIIFFLQILILLIGERLIMAEKMFRFMHRGQW